MDFKGRDVAPAWPSFAITSWTVKADAVLCSTVYTRLPSEHPVEGAVVRGWFRSVVTEWPRTNMGCAGSCCCGKMSEKNRGEIYLGSQFGRFQLKINPGSRLEVREGLMEERTGWGQAAPVTAARRKGQMGRVRGQGEPLQGSNKIYPPFR